MVPLQCSTGEGVRERPKRSEPFQRCSLTACAHICFLSPANSMNRRFSLDGLVGTTVSGRRLSRFHKGLKQVETLREAQVKIKELHHSLDKDGPLGDPNVGDEGLNRSDGLVSKNVSKYSFKKHNKTFHKVFEDIPEAEMLTETFICSLQKEVLYHGKLFVSEEHICFHSSVLLKDTKVVIPTSSVCDLKRHKSPLSMLSIHTVDGDKYHLMYVKRSRICYELLKSVCLHVEEQSANSSPQLSSAENGANGMLSSYSSHEESLDSRNNSISLEHRNSPSPSNTGVSLSQGIADKTRSLPPKRADRTFTFVFCIFILLLLLLLLVSGYIGLKIVALEEQLTALGDLAL